MSKLRGVNLGEWLVLEKWMDTSMFEGTTATDEYNLCKMLDTDEKLRRFKYHRDTYITKEDIGFIKESSLSYGVSTVGSSGFSVSSTCSSIGINLQ